MPVGTIFSLIAKEIIKGAAKSKWKSLQRDYRILSIQKPLKLSKLENNPKSIFAHALVDYGIDKNPPELVLLFSQPEIRKAIEKEDDKLSKFLEVQLHTNKNLTALKNHFPSVESLEDEIFEFREIFHGFQKQAADPFLLRRFNQMQEGIDQLLERDRKNSFEYQIENYLNGRIEDFQKNFLDKDHYIDLNGKELDIKKSNSKGPRTVEERNKMAQFALSFVDAGFIESKELYSPLDDFINIWLKVDKSKLLVILGEYGTGKTTFTRHLTHQLACHHLQKNDHLSIHDIKRRIPLYLPLRDFEETMDAFIHNQCKKYGIENLNYSEFKNRIANNEFIVIFDGFDEMTTKADLERKKSNFRKIKNLLDSSPNSKFILTSRKELFESKEDMVKVFGANTNMDFIHLLPLDDEQIQKFLKSHVNNPEAYWKHIKNTFDLKDLAQRPVLLELIIKYLPKLTEVEVEVEVEVDANTATLKASDLYKVCIQEELDRKVELEIEIPGKNRLVILQRLAVWMYENDVLSFDTRLIGEHLGLKELFNSKTDWEYEKHLSDFLTFTFLIPEGEVEYQFRISHKSFRDYLTALTFVEEINSGIVKHFAKNKITREIKKFMLEYDLNEDNLLKLILNAKSLKEESKWQGTNAASILLERNENCLAGQELSGCQLPEIDLWKANLKDTSFRNTIISNAKLQDNIFEAAEITNCDFSDSDLSISKPGLESLDGVERFSGIKTLRCRTGKISGLKSIQNLTSLEQLLCSNNQVGDLAPISKLTNLEVLNFRMNPIKDIDPLRNLKKLRKLDLFGGRFSDLDPIQNLTNLEELDCSRNSGIKDITSLKNLTNLKKLQCHSIFIKDLKPLKNLVNLEHLECDLNRITDLKPLKKLVKLKYLNCKSNSIIDNLEPLRMLTKLRFLDISLNNIADLNPLEKLIDLETLVCGGHFGAKKAITDLDPIQYLTKIKLLDCRDNLIADLSPIQNFTRLEELRCQRNQIEKIPSLEKLVTLRELNLSSNKIKDLSSLDNLPQLTELHCSSNQIEDLTPIQNLPRLTTLDCSQNQITDLAPIQNLTNLQSLFCGSNQIKDFSPLINMKQLHYIGLKGNPISDAGIQALLKARPDFHIYKYF